jgi:hypothetical protein
MFWGMPPPFLERPPSPFEICGSATALNDAEEFICKVYGAVTAGNNDREFVGMSAHGVTNDKFRMTDIVQQIAYLF